MSKKKLTPEEKAAKNRIRKLSRMCLLCYKNSIRLHRDSIFLFKKGSFATAYAISIVALEEMGKYIYLSDNLFYGWFDYGNDEKFIDKALSETYDHRAKQRIFLNYDWLNSYSIDVDMLKKQGVDVEKMRREIRDDFEEKVMDDDWGKYFPNTRKLYTRIKMLEKEKHRSLYVGFPKKGKNADLGSRIISPFGISKERVEEQITLLNDHLLSDALRVLKGVGGLDFVELEKMMTPAYVKKLHGSWPTILKKNRKKLLARLKMPNFKDE